MVSQTNPSNDGWTRTKVKSILSNPVTSILLAGPNRDFEFIVRSGDIILDRQRTNIVMMALAEDHNALFLTINKAQLSSICTKYGLSQVSLGQFLVEHFELPSGYSVESFIEPLLQNLKTVEELHAPITQSTATDVVRKAALDQAIVALSYLRLQQSIKSTIQIMERKLAIELKLGQFKTASSDCIDFFCGYLIDPD